jgi:kynurenine formamidase
MRLPTQVLSTLTVTLTLFAVDSSAQTRESGPWWPNPLWGKDDQAGGSNWITPDKVLEAVRLVKTGKIYEVGRVYEQGMPSFGQRTYALLSPGNPTYVFESKNHIVANDEFLCTEVGQVGTQFDGPGHVGMRMTMADGHIEDVYYNGFTGKEMYGPYGLKELGVEHVKPIVTRGLLIDVAGYKGVENLPHRYEVTVADVRGALEREGLSEGAIHEGDALLFRYGWAKRWSDAADYESEPPGIGLDVAKWVVERKASMVGSDQSGTEVDPNPDPKKIFPVHQELVTKNGIFNLENLNLDQLASDEAYEFLFVFTPVPFKGATGSPGRPIAIR